MRLILPCLLVAACAENPEQARLDEARVKFAEQVADYSVHLHVYVPVDEPFRIWFESVNGRVQNARWIADPSSRRMGPLSDFELGYVSTVEQQFDQIQSVLDRDLFSLEIEYDATLFYPTRIDYYLDSSDDGTSEYMWDLVVLSTP